MELPDRLRTLYRHWEGHTSSITRSDLGEGIDDNLVASLEYFIRERMIIWKKKQEGGAPPYTQDPILREYRFCNILRELDRQTIEYHEMLSSFRDDFPLWLLNMFYARMVARPETVRAVGLLSFNQQENEFLCERLLKHSRPKYGTPYVFPVSTILRSQTPTRELFIARHLPLVMKDIAREIQTWNKVSVQDGVGKLLPLFGFNLTFLWTEVLIDVAYQYPERINLFDSFPIGPGAAPTFLRINKHKNPVDIAQEFGSLRVASGLEYSGQKVVLSSENWEGIACEFRKYTNLQAGRGRKRRYRKG